VSLGNANLFFDKVEIVEEPFSCRSNPPVSFYGLCEQVSNFMEDAFILIETRQQLLGGMACAQRVCCGKGLAVLLHLSGAE
jgi:hypothetical protein